MSPSIWQILIVLAIALIFFGPKRLPGLGRSIGEAIKGFKKGLSDSDTDKELDVTDSVEKIKSQTVARENLDNSDLKGASKVESKSGSSKNDG